jgi:hypothetical protein
VRSKKYCYIIRSLTDFLADTIKLVTVEATNGTELSLRWDACPPVFETG